MQWDDANPGRRTLEDLTRRFERTLLHTGMMNQLFIDQIARNEVTEDYVKEAFENFRRAMSSTATPKVEVEYVLGFMFNEDESKVLLVHKNRPTWQAGKLNGIGGKIEAGETPLQAMEREFMEETGFISKWYTNEGTGEDDGECVPQWKLVGTRGRPALFDNQPGSYKMHIFACHFDTQAADIMTAHHDYVDARGEFMVKSDGGYKTDEPIINMPSNLEVIRRRGVEGLGWTVDIARRALSENYLVNVEDPVNMELA